MATPTEQDGVVTKYHGASWVDGVLPVETEAWPKFGSRRLIDATGDDYDLSRDELRSYASGKPWVWPQEAIYFFCDLHADADALFTSLVASGGVEKAGPGDGDFELTDAGRDTTFVIGGDCFDKGPENLRLLRVLRSLIDRGARVEILAGNHDVRAAVGIAYGGRKEPHLAHLFVRMGKKSVPLFREIWRGYLEGVVDPASLPSDQAVKDELFPPASWEDEFPAAVAHVMSPVKIQKELLRIGEKSVELVERCAREGMTLGMLHAAWRKARELFFAADGEFAWFFRDMRLARRAGSFLFIHAGLDDSMAALLRNAGIEGLNAEFRRLMEQDMFELYHGPIGNTFRTKYREYDLILTQSGVRDLYRTGIYAIVHGHRNILRGQRMLMRAGLLNFECDASVDRNTRQIEGLEGLGGAVVIVRPEGSLLGVSTDYKYVKILDASRVFASMAIV